MTVASLGPALLRVSITVAGRQFDAALPAYLPIGELTAQLVRTLPVGSRAGSTPPEPTQPPTVWALAPVAGNPMPSESCLAHQGIQDGAILVLADQRATGIRHVEDPAAQSAAVADERMPVPAVVAAFAALTASAAAALLALTSALLVLTGTTSLSGAGGRAAAAATLAVLTVVLLIAGAWAWRRAEVLTARLVTATVPVAAAGAAFCALARQSPAWATGTAAGAALLAAVLVRLVCPPARPMMLAAAVAAIVTWVAEIAVVVDGAVHAFAVPALLAALLTGALPRLSAGNALELLDARARSGEQIPAETLREQVRQISGTLQLLLWLTATVQLGFAGAAIAVGGGRSDFGWSFALVTTLAVLAWARAATMFTAAVHAAPLLATAATLTSLVLAGIGHWVPASGTIVIAAAGTVTAAAAASWRVTHVSRPSRPAIIARARVAAGWAERVAIAAAVVCAAGALGVFGALG